MIIEKKMAKYSDIAKKKKEDKITRAYLSEKCCTDVGRNWYVIGLYTAIDPLPR